MDRFVCVKCNYRFEAERKTNCPYCGKDNVEKEKSASELIEDVSKMLEK